MQVIHNLLILTLNPIPLHVVMHSSKLMKASNVATLTVYQCKPKKIVCILNSLHQSVELGASAKKETGDSGIF